MARAKKSTGKNQTEREIKFLTQDEIKRFFFVLKGPRSNALFRIAYHHGLRASEVGLLQQTDLDYKQGRITIHRLKDSISGISYPMQPDDMRRIRGYLRHRDEDSPYLFPSNRKLPIHRHTLWDAMQTYGEKAELSPEKRKLHCLRHSIAVHMLDAGADIYFVKDWLGHKNIQNTMVYVQYTTATRDAKAREVFASHRVV